MTDEAAKALVARLQSRWPDEDCRQATTLIERLQREVVEARRDMNAHHAVSVQMSVYRDELEAEILVLEAEVLRLSKERDYWKDWGHARAEEADLARNANFPAHLDAAKSEAEVLRLREALETALNGMNAAGPIMSGHPRTAASGISGRRKAFDAGIDAARTALKEPEHGR